MQCKVLAHYSWFAKIAIRNKICCTTYKNICIYKKKAVPLHHERNIKHTKGNDHYSDICCNIRNISELYFSICIIISQMKI